MCKYAVVVTALALLAACSQTGDDDSGGSAVAGQMGLPATAAGMGGLGAGMNPPPPAGGSNPMTMTGPVAGAAPATQAGSGGSAGGTPDVTVTMPPDPSGTPDAGMTMMEPACTKDLTPKAGDDECTAPLKPNDDRLCKFSYMGTMRQFYVYAPASYDACKPASMIMDCHGLSETAEVHTGKEGFNLTGMQYPKGYGSSWRRVIQGDNAIVITPQGVGDSWDTATDVPFLNAIGDMIEKIADVDPEKEYVTGISMGGMMTVATGCGDATRWRGMAPVAMLSQACNSISRPIPSIHFHAMGDQLTSYSDDRTLAQHIADLNHCKAGPTDAMKYGGPNTDPDPVCFDMPNGVGDPDAPDPLTVPLVPCKTTVPESSCVRWDQCDEGVEVIFCTVNSDSQPIGGHILYNNDTQLAPAAVAWPFFKKFWK